MSTSAEGSYFPANQQCYLEPDGYKIESGFFPGVPDPLDTNKQQTMDAAPSIDTPSTLPLEVAIATNFIGKSHKSASGQRLVTLDETIHGAVGKEGGLAFVDETAVSVRAPARRDNQSADVHVGDVMVLSRLSDPEPHYNKVARVAIEIETLHMRKGHLEGDPVADNDPHPEVIKGCIEKATVAHERLDVVGAWYLLTLRSARDQAQQKGRLSYVGSNVADRPLTTDDLNTDHRYTGPIIDFLGGPDRMTNANFTSQQDHIDDMGSIEAAMWSFNIEECVSPIDLALTAASPYSDGKLNPTFEPREGYPTPSSAVGLLSARFFKRLIYPEGGAIMRFLPENRFALAALIDERMRAGVHNPVRVVGAHANRFRVDYGGRENCTTDTNGAHVESSMSLVALQRAFRYILQSSYDNGSSEFLRKRYPRLIPLEFTEEQLQRVRTNMATMAQRRGLAGEFIAADGSICTGADILEDKIRMVRENIPPDSPYYVNDQMLSWIRLRATMPRSKYDYMLDEDRLVTADGFYQGKPGPLAVHQRVRVSQLVRRGMSAPDAIANMQDDVARAHSRYLDRITIEQLAFLAPSGT